MTVQWQGRRGDVVNALETLAAPSPTLAPGENDSRSPALTDAVHWLVDDTLWDTQDPAQSVGLILEDEAEAESVRAVLKPLLAVLERQGPGAADSAYFHDVGWQAVQDCASSALRALTSQR